MGYFVYQEGQETLYFQFQLNLTTLKFWPFLAIYENFKMALRLSYCTNLAEIFFGLFGDP